MGMPVFSARVRERSAGAVWISHLQGRRQECEPSTLVLVYFDFWNSTRNILLNYQSRGSTKHLANQSSLLPAAFEAGGPL